MSKKPRVYISGPMSKLDRKEYMRRFALADRILRKHGYRTINPTRVWACRWPWLYRIVGYRLTLLYDLWLLMSRADKFCLLPDYSGSLGAQVELRTAQMLNMEVVEGKIEWEIHDEIYMDNL